MPETNPVSPEMPEEQVFDEWKGSVSAKKFLWFIGKATAGTAAAPFVMSELTRLGLTLTPGSPLATAVPLVLPAVLGAILHVGQDAAALKSKWRWL